MDGDRNDIDQLLGELPEAVQDYLFSPDNVALNEKVLDRNNISVSKEGEYFLIVRRLFARDLPLSGLAGECKEKFAVDDAAAKKTAMDIAGYRLLPLDTYLGDVDGYIRSLGGDPNAYPPLRIQVEERTSEEAIKDVVGPTIPAVSHRLKGRMHDVVRSYLTGVRTEEQLYEILSRSEKIGGVGLSPDDAKRIAEDAKEEKHTVVIKEEKEEKEQEGSASAAIPDSATAESRDPGKKKKETFATILPEDEEEIEEARRKLPQDAVAKSEVTDQKIKRSVEELYLASGIVPPTEEMQNRLRKIIEKRLRDVRDQLETLEILAQPKELGGMSLSQNDARRLILLIENKLKDVHSMHEKAQAAEKRKWVEKEAVAAVKRVENEKDEEKMKREEAFHSVVSRSKKARAVLGGLPSKPSPKPAPVPGQPPLKLPVIPAAKVPVPAPPVSPAPKSAPLPKPPATIVRPAVTPSMLKQAMRPKVQDVKFTPKLTGPFEEIQKTTLEDFRRLSKDPNEAVLKIKDKIDLQAEESFDKKMKAVAAWNTSEVYKIYLEMMKEALEGKPMERVITEREAAKKPALRQEEINALIQLGTKLRY